MSAQMDVPFLGEIPIDPEMVKMGDSGRLSDLVAEAERDINKAYDQILQKIIER